MKTKAELKYFFSVFAACLLAGCAASPISKSLRGEAKKDVTFERALKAPETFKGALVIWGGYIVDTVNISSGTEIVVLDTPLESADAPKPPETSPGRFLARVNKFLDPAVYSKGAKVTVAGRIAGWEMLPLGKIEYAYPLLEVEEIHLWPQEKPSHNAFQFGIGVGL
jgi:outer membrane lipoprotein